eukprot:gnl/TRDRNA2_/TRDRNA2_200261_c0_seq1.p1 gnl/TRDRNA2_/TRDRNA2_200261_c0~~gnl/TRDRNA2_/TRDRNA2_200261_c0_seq1.p1  ORF type:complete len:334 (+),score=69.14 gnl/TRDRNA2_/TRDRNA2_200261_c0_seq1:96-1004(+)
MAARAAGQAPAIDQAQEWVQQLLRVAAQLQAHLAGGAVLSSEATRRLLEDYFKYLRRLDQAGESLGRCKIPLDAVRFLDETSLSLGPWCRSLAERLKATNEAARGRAAPLDELRRRLEDAGWAPAATEAPGASPAGDSQPPVRRDYTAQAPGASRPGDSQPPTKIETGLPPAPSDAAAAHGGHGGGNGVPADKLEATFEPSAVLPGQGGVSLGRGDTVPPVRHEATLAAAVPNPQSGGGHGGVDGVPQAKCEVALMTPAVPNGGGHGGAPPAKRAAAPTAAGGQSGSNRSGTHATKRLRLFG